MSRSSFVLVLTDDHRRVTVEREGLAACLTVDGEDGHRVRIHFPDRGQLKAFARELGVAIEDCERGA
jgi:hypothetical protein